MLNEYDMWWLDKVQSFYLDEFCYHLPLTPKLITDMNDMELGLLRLSAWEFHDVDGIQFFICKRLEQ
jgi:hypothetical protein